MARAAELRHKVEIVVERFLRSRIEVLYYLWKGDKNRMDAARGILESLVTSARELQPLLATAEERNLMADIITKAETYKTRMDGFVQAAEAQTTELKQMAVAADKAAAVADEAVTTQRESMAAESSMANTINLAVAGAAVLLGLLFAVLITKAILRGIRKAITVADAVSHGRS